MICKACGAQLAKGDTVCPQCGSDVPSREGGVGFWDLLEKPEGLDVAPAALQDAPAPSSAAGIGGLSEGLPPKVKGIIGALGAACVGGLLATSIMTFNAVQTIRADQQTTTIALNERMDQLDAQDKALEEAFGQHREATEVVMEPVEAVGAIGSSGTDDKPLLTMALTYSVDSFTWERLVGDAWQPVVFDGASGANKELGIRVVESTEGGVSRLVADGLTSSAAGTYRCVATTSRGDVVGRVATLTTAQN